MADIPLGAKLIDNPVSAAPGFNVKNVYVNNRSGISWWCCIWWILILSGCTETYCNTTTEK